MAERTDPITVHFVPDDKACAQLRELYSSAYPGEHRFISFSPLRTPQQTAPTHLEYCAGDTFVCNDGYWTSPQLKAECNLADIVVLHSLHGNFAHVLDSVRSDTIIAWNGMGGDIYRWLPGFGDNNLMQPATMRAANFVPRSGKSALTQPKRAHAGDNIARKIRAMLDSIRALKPRGWRIRWERIDLFSGQEHEFEHQLLRLAIPQFRATPTELGWGYIDDDGTVASATGCGKDIQIGHSAWPMNNHLEVIAQLSRVDLSGRTVVIPLSYGSDAYAELVDHSANRCLSGSIAALRSFLPRTEYFRLISRCGVLFMNSHRVAGLANIAAHLARGSRLVLPMVNPLLQRLRSLGFSVDCMPQTTAEMERLLQPLSPEEQARNRELAYAQWSRQAVQSRIALLYHYWDIARQAGRCSRPTGLWG